MSPKGLLIRPVQHLREPQQAGRALHESMLVFPNEESLLSLAYAISMEQSGE